jgi:hypothetical protein
MIGVSFMFHTSTSRLKEEFGGWGDGNQDVKNLVCGESGNQDVNTSGAEIQRKKLHCEPIIDKKTYKSIMTNIHPKKI